MSKQTFLVEGEDTVSRGLFDSISLPFSPENANALTVSFIEFLKTKVEFQVGEILHLKRIIDRGMENGFIYERTRVNYAISRYFTRFTDDPNVSDLSVINMGEGEGMIVQLATNAGNGNKIYRLLVTEKEIELI